MPGEAIGLSSSSRGYVCPEHSGGDRGADCEVRVGPIELSLGCFLIVVVKLRGLAFACRAPWKAARQDELTLVPANACVALDPSGLPNRWATLTGFCLFVYLFWPSLMSLPLPPSGRGSLLAQLQKLKGSDSE